MILDSKNEVSFGDAKTKDNLWVKCDYCDNEFLRSKKQIIRSHKNLPKDACKLCGNAKRKEVMKIKYGDENLFATKAFKEKSAKTNLEKYGSESYFATQDFQDKRAKTCIEKYGVKNPLQNNEIKTKQRNTCLKKYGMENYAQTEEFNNKTKQTNLKKYGVESAMQLESTKQSRKQTNLKKYGVENYTQTPEYWQRRKESTLKKYGVEHTHQLPEVIDKMKQTCSEKYGVTNYAKLESSKQKYAQTCQEKYGVPNPLCLTDNRAYGKEQNAIKEWLNKELGYDFQTDYKILSGKEIDLFDSDLNLAIEYCGLFWHNEMSQTPRFKNYHYDKYTICDSQDIRLITIFEDEWKHHQDTCRSILKSAIGRFEDRLGARQCQIKPMDKKHVNEFLNQFHLRGKSFLNLASWGLIHKGCLIEALSLGRHPRIQNTLTIDRLCTKPGYQIVGGASKLLKVAKKWGIDNGYKTITTWSDNRWSNGIVYDKIGFILDKELPPDYSYVNMTKPSKRISKQSQKKSCTQCPDHMTEREWALENGFARIWDCGKKRWVLHL